jgi:hypothetical protein
MPPCAFKGAHWARAITWAHSFWAIDRRSEPQLSSLLERDWPSGWPELETECKTPTALLGRISCECSSGWRSYVRATRSRESYGETVSTSLGD